MCNSPAISTQSGLLIVQQMTSACLAMTQASMNKATYLEGIHEAYQEFLRHKSSIQSLMQMRTATWQIGKPQHGSNAYDDLHNWTGSCLIMIMMCPDTYLPETRYPSILPFIDPRGNLCDALLNWGTEHHRSGQGPNNLPTNTLEGILCMLGEKDSVKLHQAWHNTLVQTLRLHDYQCWTITQDEFIRRMIDDDKPVYHSIEEQWAMTLCVTCKNDPLHYWRHFTDAIDVLWFHAAGTDDTLVTIAESLTHNTYMKEIPGLTEHKAKVVQSAMVQYARRV